MTKDERVDVFLSYRHREPTAGWVRGSLVPALEAADCSVLIDVRDFEVAGVLIDEMEDASRRGRVTLAVVDATYAESGFTRFERVITSNLVVVVRGQVPLDGIPAARATVELKESDDPAPVIRAIRSILKRVYVLEAEEDQEWVEGVLLPALRSAEVSADHCLDIGPGPYWSEAVEAGIAKADRVVVVLSSAYLRGMHPRADVLVEHVEALQHINKVLPVRREAEIEMPLRFQAREIVDASRAMLWKTALDRICQAIGVTPVASSAPPPCPYPGMRPFKDTDRDIFFGREEVVGDVLTMLRRDRFAAVIGPSGSGKSSLVAAGVIPRARLAGIDESGPVLIETVRPTASPLVVLQQACARLSDGQLWAKDAEVQRHAKRLLVIDQFEELFTNDPAEITAFTAELERLHDEEPDLYLIISLRADFYGSVMSSSVWPLVARNRVELSPLSGAGLREAICGPARQVGVVIEGSLVERLAGEMENQPGLLPFLQETLRRLWSQLHWLLMTLDSYDELAVGSCRETGVLHAIRLEAERALSTVTSAEPEDERVVRATLLRLIQFGEGAPHTRRQQPLSELRSAATDPLVVERVIEMLGQSRILTTSDDAGDPVVDLSHEAIIRGWPRLADWVKANQAIEKDRRRWLQRSRSWVEGSGELLQGNELSLALAWLRSPATIELGVDQAIADYITTSDQRVRSRTRRRRLVFAAGVVSLALLAATFAQLAVSSRTAQRKAESESNRRVAGQLLAAASIDRLGMSLPSLLTRAADVISPTAQSLAEMLAMSERQRAIARTIPAPEEDVGFEAAAILGTEQFPADKRVLVGDGAGRLFLFGFGLATNQPLAQMVVGHGVLVVAARSGSMLAAVGGGNARPKGDSEIGYDGGLDLVEVEGQTLRRHPVGLPTDSPVSAAVFVGDRLFAGTWDGVIYVIDIADLNQPRIERSLAIPVRSDSSELACDIDRADRTVRSLAVDANERRLAAGANNCLIAVWDLAQLSTSRVLLGHSSKVRSVAFSGSLGSFLSPDDDLFSTGDDRTIRAWDLDSESSVGRVVADKADDVRSIALCIAPDGRSVVTAGRDHRVRRWVPGVLGRLDPVPEEYSTHTTTVRGVLCPSDHEFVSVAGDGVTFWDIEQKARSGRRISEPDDLPVQSIVLRPGSVGDIAVASEVRLLIDRPDGQQIQRSEPGRWFDQVAYSSDGSFVGALTKAAPAGGPADDIRLYDADSLRPALSIPSAILGDLTTLSVLDDRNLVAGSSQGHLLVLRDGKLTEIWTSGGQAITAVALVGDGRILVGDLAGTLYCGAPGETVLSAKIELGRRINSLSIGGNGTVAAGTNDGAIAVFGEAMAAGRGTQCEPRNWRAGVLPTLHDRILSVGLAADGQFLIAANSDGTAEMWDLPRSLLLVSLTIPGDHAQHVAVTNDLSSVVVAGSSAVDRFTLGRSALRTSLCEIARQNLTAEQEAAFLPEVRYRASAKCFD